MTASMMGGRMVTEVPDQGERGAPRCRTCARKLRNTTAPLCHACRARVDDQLAQLPLLVDRLAYATVKTGPGVGEFVSGGAFGSRPPVNLAALSLLAITPEAIGLALAFPAPPVDKAGLSIPAWVIGWAAVWRSRWGHGQPVGVRARPVEPVVERGLEPLEPIGVGATTWGQLLAAIVEARTVRDAQFAARFDAAARRQAYLNRIVLGLAVVRVRDDTVDGGWRPLQVDDDDPDVLALHWRARFGRPKHIRRLMADLAYLATWFDRAVDDFDDVDQFVVGLRSLVAAARAAVGDRSDLVRLGRCPESVRDRETGEVEICGGLLVQDPTVTHIICPRCRAETTAVGRTELAGRIRMAWGPDSLAGREEWAG